MIRNLFAKENRKRTWKVFLFLFILAVLLAGALPLKGKNVFYCAYDGDVVAASRGYMWTDRHYEYTGDENSWILLQNNPSTEYIAVKFKEEAAADVPVSVRQFSKGNVLLEEENTVWEKGSCLLEIFVSHEDTELIEVYIPESFTIDRAMYAAHYQRYRKSAVFFAGVFAAVLLATLLLAGTGPGCRFLSRISGFRNYLRGIFRKERMRMYRLEWVTFILILVVGGLYAFLEPPVAGLCYDEQDHYVRVIRIGHAHSSTIAMSDYDVMYQAASSKITSESYKWEERTKYSGYLNALDKKEYLMFLEKRPFAITDIPYVPYSVLHLILTTLHVPWTIRFMLGRWLYVWFLAVFTALGMKRLKSGKLVAAMIALTPGVIFLAGNYGYDTWITALCMYGMCCVFGELQDPQRPIGSGRPAKLFGALAVSGFPKPVYFPINAIAFFMPRSKFKTRKGYWLYKLAAVLCVAFPILLTWLRMFAGSTVTQDIRGGSDVNAAAQVQFALQEPVRFAHVILNYLKGYLNPFGFGKGWANNLAYLGNLQIGGLVFILILLAAVVSWRRKEPGKFPWWYRLGLLFIYFAVGAIVTVSMYVVFTPVGAETVQGAQQRYLTPVLFPTIYGITRISGGKYLTNKTFQTIGHAVLLALMAAINLYAVWKLILIRY